jgi:DNA-directed RNA polymerase specialized sigma24 family protein
MLGIPEGTVKSDVFHGRRALRKVLESVKEEWDA